MSKRASIFLLLATLPPITIQAPLLTTFTTPGNQSTITSSGKKYSLVLEDPVHFPITIEAHGPKGGLVRQWIQSPNEFRPLTFAQGIVLPKDPNPETIPVLPLLCPRLQGNIYHGEHDRLNHIPVFELLEPDARAKEHNGQSGQKNISFLPPYKAYSDIDGQNVLLLKSITLTYDYEDSSIVDYEGPNPLTGKMQTVHEGNGGFYANLHYAILPYEKKITQLDTQTLLHLAEGKLREINRTDLTPEIKTHSLLPGPFLSRANHLYDMCEWGDTAHQARLQKMEYSDIALWDWDYSVKNADHVLLIVWEGDEEDWMIQQQLIDPTWLTDDLVGVFEIHRKNTLTPLTLTNARGDFSITILTGNLENNTEGLIFQKR